MKKYIFLILCFFSLSLCAGEITKSVNFKFNCSEHKLILTIQEIHTKFALYLKDEFIGSVEFRSQLEDSYYINVLNVDNKFRNKKYAELLLKIAFAYLKKKGAKEIKLTAQPFELSGTSDEYEPRREYLFKYYAKFGFVLQSKSSGSMVKQILPSKL